MIRFEVPIRYSVPKHTREYRYCYDLNIEGYADKWRDAIAWAMRADSIEVATVHEFWTAVREKYLGIGGQFLDEDVVAPEIVYE